MPARFPDTTLAAQPEAAEPQREDDAPPSCQVLVEKAGGRDIWALGSRYILKNRGYYPGSEVEVQNTNFVAERGIRVPNIVAAWAEDNRFFCIQSRVDGESLEEALPRLTQADLARIGKQLGQYLLHLKNITSGRMAMLDGRPVIDRRLLKPLKFGGYSVCASESDVAASLSLAIRDRVDDSTLRDLMAKLPASKPFTFSHSDVHEGNIMVKDGNFVGLIDWELAGYYPVWWEFVNSCELLSDHLPRELQHDDALEWFRMYHTIRDRRGNEAIAERLTAYLGK